MKINQIVINENQQLDELSWDDIKQGANKIQQGAQNFQKNVADTGDAVAGAANAIGGAGKELAKQTIARPVGAAYNAVKGAAGAAADTVANTYGDVKKGVQAVGQGVSTAQSDLGNAAKFAGQRAADALGGVGQAVGAAASVPQGVGRAAKAGYNAGVQAIGGPDKEQGAAQSAQGAAPAGGQVSSLGNGQASAADAEGEPENVKYIQQQISTKEKEIQTLKSQLAAAKDIGKSTSKSSSSSSQNKVASGFDDLTNAVRAGVGMGAAGQSLMSPKPGDDMQTVKDKSGKDHQYKKVGDKWMDMATNKEVDPATAAMLDKQKGAAAPTQAQQQSQDQEKEQPAVWKNNRAPEGTPASTSPQAAAAAAQPQGKDVQARMANQLGAAPAGIPAKDGQPAATPNFGQQATGYGKTTYNVPTGGVLQQPAIQPTTGAKAVPQEPAAPAQTASAQDDQNKPGSPQSKTKGQQPALAEMDFSAILAKQTKIRL